MILWQKIHHLFINITYQDNECVGRNDVKNIRTKKYKISSGLDKNDIEKLINFL